MRIRRSNRPLARQLAVALTSSVILIPIWPHPMEAQDRWRLSSDPVLILGTSTGPRHSAFHQVGGAVRMPEGDVVVADLATMELRVFSASGDFLRSFGGRGGGPEEFEGLAWVDRCGSDSIAAYDFVRTRLTWWTPEGQLLRSITPAGPTDGLPPYTVTCGPTGRLAAMGWPNVQAYQGGEGPYRMNVNVALLSPSGQILRTVGSFPGPERYRSTANDRPRPLGRATVVRMGTEEVYIGTADRYQIAAVRSDGTRRDFGMATPPLPLTRDLLRTWQDSMVQRVPPANRPSIRQQLSGAVMPDLLPAYSDIRVDPTGAVWVARFGAPGETTTVWDVFQEDGQLVASLDIPLSFRPTEIGDEYVLGVSTDELGVERVMQFMLIR